MIFFQNLIKKIPYFSILLIFLISCQKADPGAGEKVLIEPDPIKKTRDFADKGGGIFGDINKVGKGSGSGNFEFASTNVLWRGNYNLLLVFTN
jgi:hypothetical protein